MFNKFKNIFFNFSIRVTGQIISKVLGFITLPFIARAIGPEGFGDYSFIITLITYMAILVEWGYKPFGIREVAKNVNNSKIVDNIITTRFTFGIISILIGSVLIYIFFYDNKNLIINIYIGFGFIIAQIFNIDYYFFGDKKLLIPTISQLIGQIFFVIGVILFIKTINDFRLLMILYVTYQIISSLIMIIIYTIKNKINIRFSLNIAISTIKKTFKLGLSSRIEQLSKTYPILIIPLFYSSNYELGLFSSSFKFFSIVVLAYQTIMITIAPYIVELKNKSVLIQKKRILILVSFLFIFGIFSSILVFFSGEEIMNLLFGKSFGEAIRLVKLICIYMLPFWPITMVLGTILIYYNYDKYYMYSTIVNAILLITLTPILIKFLGIDGAIQAIGIANFGTILTIIYFLIKLEPQVFKLKII